MKLGQPIGEKLPRAPGHREGLAKASGLCNEENANNLRQETTPPIAVSKSTEAPGEGRWPGDPWSYAPPSWNLLHRPKEEGPKSKPWDKKDSHLPLHTWHFPIWVYSNPGSALTQTTHSHTARRSCHEVTSHGAPRSRTKTWHLTLAVLSPELPLSSCKWAYEWHREQKAERQMICFWSVL